MRIISGSARGHKLFTLDGLATRPTADRVKEAEFSIIQHFVPGARVLDLFAGSGALGLESLSRGAAFCDFVDASKQAVSVINKNIQKTRLFDRCAVHNVSHSRFLDTHPAPYGLIFLDPPYHQNLCDEALSLIFSTGLLQPGGIIVCETAANETIQSPFTLRREGQYGKTKIWIFEAQQ